MTCDAGHGDRWGDAEKDQEGGHQKPASDAKHPGYEADRQAHRQDQQDVYGLVRNGQVYLQNCRSLVSPWSAAALALICS